MSMDLFNRIVNEAQDFIKHTYLHLWGEPTLNRNLPEMIRRVKEFSTIDLATHGLGLDDRMIDALAECDAISVSIDGITQPVYETYRVGGRFTEAMSGLSRLIGRCGHKVNWTFVVFRQNEHQMEKAQQFADAIGAHIGFKAPVFWDKTTMSTSMPTEEQFRRYSLVNGEWQLKADRFKCREFWDTAYVLPSGDMITCCYDGAAEYVVGNVNESSVLEVWNGEKYNEMRHRHSGGTLNALCSKHCNMLAVA